MIANPPPVTISVNGHPVGRIGARWRGANPRRHPYTAGQVRKRRRAREAPSSWLAFYRERQKVRAARRRHNPPRGEVEIYSDIERIYGKKGRHSVAAGEHFVHNFRHAAAFGRPDGTVLLRGRGGRRLWDYFKA